MPLILLKNKMKVQEISPGIIKVTVNNKDYNLDAYYNDLIFLEKSKILTFGDTNFRVLEKYFKRNRYKPELLDLCFDDDKSIGLEMPRTWYLNKGKHALSIAMYYNYLNYHGVVETKNLDTFNSAISDNYGRLACIEIYLEDELKKFLKSHQIRYFGTPKTLTECVRYLEGWSLEKYPRLKGYVVYSNFIEIWSKLNFPKMNINEWRLGKEKSSIINKNGLTNVRKAVRYFWENYLLKYHSEVCPEDVEIDILDGEKFHNIRQPKVILISEDLFSDDNSKFEIFKNLTKKLGLKKIYLSKAKNGFQLKNAKAAKSIYPESLIVMIENDASINRNMSLINPIKYSINTDTVITTKVLRYALEKFF